MNEETYYNQRKEIDKKYDKLRGVSEKINIAVGIAMIIAFTILILNSIIGIVEQPLRNDIDQVTEKVEQIEKDNVYRDEVINQTRSELNF